MATHGYDQAMAVSPPHIGTLREKALHASLKKWCSQPGDRFEVRVNRYVIDVVRDDLLIEIQTSGFSSVRKKLGRLLDLGYAVRVLHPIPVDKTIVRISNDGEVLSRRRSPKHGTSLDLFGELVSIPRMLAHPRLEIQLVLTIEDEYRRHDPERAWRRRGWVVQERRLVGIDHVVDLRGPEDLVAMLPDRLPAPFTTADISEGAGCSRRVAQQMTYCLRKLGVVEVVGRRGRTIEYRLGSTSAADPG